MVSGVACSRRFVGAECDVDVGKPGSKGEVASDNDFFRKFNLFRWLGEVVAIANTVC